MLEKGFSSYKPWLNASGPSHRWIHQDHYDDQPREEQSQGQSQLFDRVFWVELQVGLNFTIRDWILALFPSNF